MEVVMIQVISPISEAIEAATILRAMQFDRPKCPVRCTAIKPEVKK